MSYATKEQLAELAAYMASQINVPTIGIGGGYAPIGTIISYMGTVAPQDYLVCDGSTENITDYPQLADFFEAQFGSKNYFGGDGVTTFAVPDLQGEFLRGTGTNSHTNQGSGANVGVHQDGTGVGTSPFGNDVLHYTIPDTNGPSVINYDSRIQTNKYKGFNVNTSTYSDEMYGLSTVRPTNTSILWCIKAVVAGDVYSTEERVVGTWIDGKPLYQKTLSIINKSLSSGDNTIIDDPSFPSISTLISISLINYSPNHNTYHDVVRMYPNAAWTGGINYIDTSNGLTIVYNIGSNYANEGPFNIYVTVRYTKTTD